MSSGLCLRQVVCSLARIALLSMLRRDISSQLQARRLWDVMMQLRGPLQICADCRHQLTSLSKSLCAQILDFQPTTCQSW